MEVIHFSRYFILFFLMVSFSVPTIAKPDIQVGAEQTEEIVRLVEGKKVAIVVNQTSIIPSRNIHLLDMLLENSIEVVKIFAPEHGFREMADAGATIKDGKDSQTGIPIVSIYGNNKKPTASQLKDIDLVLFDIQDVGARFYTYISTMHYVMEACAENNKDFVVLDRPNPNDHVDGPVLKKKYSSFVGMHPIPVLHGMTVGELALMINQEGWLSSGPHSCRVKVVKMKNWNHGDPYSLPVKPSPNLPNDQSIQLYPSLCFFEATEISIGRGTYFPFQVIGYPDQSYGSFSFTPQSLPGYDTNPLQKNKECFGVDLREYPFREGLTLKFILDFYEKTGKKPEAFFKRGNWFDLLAGTNELRQQISQGMTEADIRATWQNDLNEFRKKRAKYLLYP